MPAWIGCDALLGYDVDFVLDASHSFDRAGPRSQIDVYTLTRVTASNPHGEYARIVSTDDLTS